jgi:hypothetical protein
MYDPVIGRVLSPDNYVVDASNAQDYNRYTYARNNPLSYTDPSGDWLFYIGLGFGYSQQGGFSVSLDVGLGFKNGLSAGLSIGYSFGNNSFNVGVNASYAGSYVSAGYNSASGWNVGTGYSVGGQIWIFSLSFFSTGANYSQNGGFSTNVGWFNYNQYAGFSVNPSFSVGVQLGKWGTEIYESDVPSDFDIEKDASTAFRYNNNEEIRNLIGEDIINDYLIDGVFAFGDVSELDGSQSMYLRNESGYILKYPTEGGAGNLVGGMTKITYSGWAWKYRSTIYLSQIRDGVTFANTINHELTHAYHNSIGLRNYYKNEKVYRSITESSAYTVGNRPIPIQFQNSRYPLYLPPKLVNPFKFY